MNAKQRRQKDRAYVKRLYDTTVAELVAARLTEKSGVSCRAAFLLTVVRDAPSLRLKANALIYAANVKRNHEIF